MGPRSIKRRRKPCVPADWRGIDRHGAQRPGYEVARRLPYEAFYVGSQHPARLRRAGWVPIAADEALTLLPAVDAYERLLAGAEVAVPAVGLFLRRLRRHRGLA